MEITKSPNSIYTKIYTFRENERERRATESFQIGKYSSYQEAYDHTRMPSMMSIVKNIVLGRSDSHKYTFEDKVEALRYIIHNIMEFDEESFLNWCSSENLKSINLYVFTSELVRDADIKLKTRCMFNTDLVLYALLRPDDIDRLLVEKASGRDIFYCKDKLKESLCRAGSYDANKALNIQNDKKTHIFKSGYGLEVDNILIQAMEKVFSEDGNDTIPKKLGFLANIYKDGMDFEKERVGIVDVIEKRGYSSLLDFYFLNLEPDLQDEYFEDYLHIRADAGIPEEKYIRVAALAKIYNTYYSEPDTDKVISYVREYYAEHPDVDGKKALKYGELREKDDRKKMTVKYYEDIMSSHNIEQEESVPLTPESDLTEETEVLTK